MCIEPGTVLSLSQIVFPLKGLSDIWMVYNSTSCDLNLALWVPHFGLKNFQHTLHALLSGYSQCDMYLRDFFLNFLLHPEFIPYIVIDVTHIKSR